MIGLEGALPQLPEADPATGAMALAVDTSVFAVAAVLRATYKVTDRCHVFVERAEPDAVRVVVTLRPKAPGVCLDLVVGELANELIDQQVREVLAQEAGTVREIIVAQAFAEGNLLDSDRDQGDYLDDPEDIGALRGPGALARSEGAGCGEPE
jgi:His-Xaa-Ser system protein HxsD